MAPEPPSGGGKRLTKGHDRRLGGVAGGLAEYFDVDPTLIRVLFVVGLFLPGLGLGVVVAYVLMWFIIPDPEGAAAPASTARGGPDATLILGIIILALGLLLLLRTSWVWTSWIGWAGASLIWPAILIGIGAYVIYSARRRS